MFGVDVLAIDSSKSDEGSLRLLEVEFEPKSVFFDDILLDESIYEVR